MLKLKMRIMMMKIRKIIS